MVRNVGKLLGYSAPGPQRCTNPRWPVDQEDEARHDALQRRARVPASPTSAPAQPSPGRGGAFDLGHFLHERLRPRWPDVGALLRIVRDAIAMRPGGVGAAEAERTVRIGNAGFHVATIGRAGEQAAVLPVTRAPRRLHALATRPPRPIALRLRAHEWVTRARASQWSRLGGHGRNCGRVAGRSDVVVVRAAHGGRAAGEREREDQPDSACHFGVNPL